MSPITGLLQRPLTPVVSSTRHSMSLQSPNLATLGLEQLKKTAGTTLPILEVLASNTCICFLKALQKPKDSIRQTSYTVNFSHLFRACADQFLKEQQATKNAVELYVSQDTFTAPECPGA